MIEKVFFELEKREIYGIIFINTEEKIKYAGGVLAVRRKRVLHISGDGRKE